jgi:membrane-associated phospholipid phosphatase
LFLVWALGAAVVVLIGLIVHASNRQPISFRPIAWSHRLASRIGAIRAAAMIAVTGALLTFVACLPLGLLAKRLEAAIDRPTFRWIYPKVHHSAFTSANELLTKMGNHSQVRLVCAVAAIALAVAWRRYFFVPVVVIASTFLLEKFGQKLLAVVVDRGHPPTSLGTFPSGGCARVVSLYGVIIFLVLASVPTLARRWRILMWTALALAAWLEAFSRVYLSKHWLTDAVAGLVYGTLLLLVMVGATAALTQYLPAGAGTRARPNHRTTTAPATGAGT